MVFHRNTPLRSIQPGTNTECREICSGQDLEINCRDADKSETEIPSRTFSIPPKKNALSIPKLGCVRWNAFS